LESKKKAHAIEENEMTKRLAASEEKKQDDNKIIAALKAELAELTSQENDLQNTLETVEPLCRVLEEKEREHEEIRVERTALFAKCFDLESRLTTAKASCDASNREILHAKEIQQEIEVGKATNDGIEFEMLAKNRAMVEERSKVMEQCSTLTNELAHESDNLDQGLDDHKKHLGSLQEEQSSLVRELDEKQAVPDEQRVEVTKDYEADCVHFPHSAQTTLMPLRSCIVCRAVALPDIQLQYCAGCQSALYCSETCQKKDWRKHHKKICKLLNVGHGDMQVRIDEHTSQSIALKELLETLDRDLDEDDQGFFKLFKESTFEGSLAAARKMKKFAKELTKTFQKILLFESVLLLVRTSDSKMLSWPNSPLLVMLQFVDPNLRTGDEHEPLQEGETRVTPLHHLAELADPSDYTTHENQRILAKQLIEHGAKVDVVSIPDSKTPLHNACSGGNVTNLDFVEILLKAGADPNSQDHRGVTPLMYTVPDAPGAAKFLLNWPTTDVSITTQSGGSFVDSVRLAVNYFSEQIACPDNPNRVQHQFVLRQWREIEEMLVKRDR
jgi:hypothetical protein